MSHTEKKSEYSRTFIQSDLHNSYNIQSEQLRVKDLAHWPNNSNLPVVGFEQAISAC